MTDLYGGVPISKDDPLVDAYGTIDELNSFLGVVIAESTEGTVVSSLKVVQRLLFVAGGDAACELKNSKAVPRISEEDTRKLDEKINTLLTELPKLRNFILPGGSSTGAKLQLASSVCRRAERKLVYAAKFREMNPELLRFFNALSKYFFNLSRWVNMHEQEKEEVWKG